MQRYLHLFHGGTLGCYKAKYLSYFYNMQPKLQQLDLFGGPALDIGGVKEKKK
jgi:hypothetical protein